MGCTSGIGARLVVVAGMILVSSAAAQQGEERLTIRRSALTGAAVMVSTSDRSPLPMPGVVAGGRVDPIDALAAHGRHFGVADPARQLSRGATRQDALQHTHTTFHQVHGGVPVYSGILRVHENDRGQPYAINGRFYAVGKDVPTVPRIDAETAARTAIQQIEVKQPQVDSAALTIVDPGWYGDDPLGPRLAWHIVIHDPAAELHEAFFVDAVSGKVLDQWSEMHTARDRRVYDGEFNWPLPGVLLREEEGPPVLDHAEANQAYNYLGDTYDYFFRAFGRDSMDDDGMPLVATVNSTAAGCPNAAWSERVKQAMFCPGTTADDIVAHEVVHGITSRTAALIYQNQPGQLNESFSDVFGELVDLFNGDAAFIDKAAADVHWSAHESGPGSDSPNLRRGDVCYHDKNYAEGFRWLLGEDAPSFGVLRDMWAPVCFGMPDRASHPFQLCQRYDNGGVHYGSSVPNRAFSLVTDGGEFNGFTVRGIGPIKSGAVWYRALNHYVTAAANFQDVYYDLNQAALDLIGTAPNDPRTGLPSAEVFTADDALQVDLALQATEMNTPGRCGLAYPVLSGAAPPRCGNKTVLFLDDFEGESAGWTVSNSGPTTAYDWVVATELPSDRPGSAYFADDPTIGNCFDVDESGLHSLISPPIVVPQTQQQVMASFTHHMAAESGFDGGNVKIRVNDGDWMTLPGEAFLFNPYNSILRLANENSANPIAGQEAWTHAGGGWGTSVIDLNGLVQSGDRLQLRFDFGKDQCDGVEGWYVDDVEVFLCPDCNRNGRRDMEEMRTSITSPPLTNIGLNHPGVYVLPSLLPAAGDVTITISAIADLGSIREDFGVALNGTSLGRLFLDDHGRDCPREADVDSLVISAETFNSLYVPGGQNQIEISASFEIDDHLCGELGYVRVLLDYKAIGGDADGNMVPDECENCAVAATPLPEPLAVVKSRYVSFVPNNAGRWTAIRIAVLPPGASLSEWDVYWVDRPWRTLTKEGGQVQALARLSCEPVFMDWSSYSEVHVGDRVIVPRGLYRAQEIDLACVPPDEPLPMQPFGGHNVSGGLNINTTALYGDVIGGGITTPPDSQINVLDIGAAVDVMIQRTNAVDLARADLSPDDPDGVVNIIDVSRIVDSWKGFPYPFQTEKICP